MAGLISSLFQRLAPRRKVGYAFKLRADYSVSEIYGEKQSAGMEVTLAVRGRDIDVAKTSALEAARAVAKGLPVSIVAMKDAYEVDFTGPDQVCILDQQVYGQSKHGRF